VGLLRPSVRRRAIIALLLSSILHSQKLRAAILDHKEEAMCGGVTRENNPGILTLWNALPALEYSFNF
jgi:hypothetical protein